MFLVQLWNILSSLYFYIFLVSSFEVNDISVNLATKLRIAVSVSEFSVGHVFVFVLFLTAEPFQCVFSYRSK